MNKLVIGIAAHVDAGKTSLSEALLYVSGRIDRPGRVDNKDAYLDTYELEKERGITIYAKQALLERDDVCITLLDTPGHVDFSAEMERALWILDYAVLLVSGADGVQAHTKTLWRLLKQHQTPVFIFINKMDQNGADQDKLIGELKSSLDDGCILFDEGSETGGLQAEDASGSGPALGASAAEHFYDQLAMCSEELMEDYLQTGRIKAGLIQKAVQERIVFPCFFGSALKLSGVEALLRGMIKYAKMPQYSDRFGARVFKVTRDEQGNRLTHMKLTGGGLRVKDVLTNGIWEEKVNQIRLYSGQKYEAVSAAAAGSVCAVTGLTRARPGEGLGEESCAEPPSLMPVLSYRMLLCGGEEPRAVLPKLRLLEEEEPSLHIEWNEPRQEIMVQLMGEVQLEILQSVLQERFGLIAGFDDGSIVYRETIRDTVEGVGHFEPLRHYAEVHLLLEAGEPGSGLQYQSLCSEDLLAKSWQRLILTHLDEKPHKGVLTGADITDMKITLVAGRAHNKHTEGGDFREATYRAVRQGLKEAQSVLLEPYYAFELELPEKMIGKAMTDVEKMHGTCEIRQADGKLTILAGSAPVSTMRNYQRQVASYSKGLGRLFCSVQGYGPCHNANEVIESAGYDAQSDVMNPSSSVFCANGAGFLVSWHEVKSYMHLDSWLKARGGAADESSAGSKAEEGGGSVQTGVISLEEIDQIISRTFYANQGKKSAWKKNKAALQDYDEKTRGQACAPVVSAAAEYGDRQREPKEEYLLVDAYNIIFAWPDLKELAEGNMDGARTRLLEALSNYRAIRGCRIIAVFDAYRVAGHQEEVFDYQDIRVVYTKEAQTADQYIERFAYDNKKKYAITVATSDALQQMIVRGSGSLLLSAAGLRDEVKGVNERLRKAFIDTGKRDDSHLADMLSAEDRKRLEIWLKEEDRKTAKAEAGRRM